MVVDGSGVLFFWVIGLQSLLFMDHGNKGLSLRVYNGMSLAAPGASVMLFVAFLGVSGFPISPTYIGQDLLLHHAAADYIWLVLVLAMAIVVNGISLARVYTKVCMGDPVERRKSEFAHFP